MVLKMQNFVKLKDNKATYLKGNGMHKFRPFLLTLSKIWVLYSQALLRYLGFKYKIRWPLYSQSLFKNIWITNVLCNCLTTLLQPQCNKCLLAKCKVCILLTLFATMWIFSFWFTIGHCREMVLHFIHYCVVWVSYLCS